MTHNENITAILECYFTGFKKEIIDSACNRILEQDPKTGVLDKIRAEIADHCGLVKENRCRYCYYCRNLMGIREILEIIDKYMAESEDKE